MCKDTPADTVNVTWAGKEYAVCDECNARRCYNCKHLATYPSAQWKCTKHDAPTNLNDACIDLEPSHWVDTAPSGGMMFTSITEINP